MIEFKTTPKPCSFSKNPVNFEIKATDFSKETSIYPSIELTCDYIIQIGKFFQFKFINPDTNSEEVIRFLAVASPAIDGYEVPGDITWNSPSTFQYVQVVYQRMKLNKKLSSFYDVTLDGMIITLTAKQPIEALIPYGFYANWSGLYPAFKKDISTVFWKAQKRSGHRVDIKVYFESDYNSNIFEAVSEQTTSVDGNGIQNIDISNILDSETKNSFETPPIPDVYNSNQTEKATVLRKFFIEAVEKWDNMIADQNWQTSEVFAVHYGGVSMDDFARQNPFEYLKSQYKSLTWWKDKKRLYPDQSDWMNVMNASVKDDSYTATLEILYKDATSDISTIGSQYLKMWETMIITVGFQQLQIIAIQNPNKEVYAWKVRVENGDNVVVYRRTYMLSQPDNFKTRTLIYLNSFGLPESFVATGFWKDDITTSNEIASHSLAHDYKSINGRDFVFNKLARNNFSARTGALSKDEAKSLQDVLNVSPVFLLEKGYLVPVIIDSSSFEIDDEESIIQTLEFDLSKSLEVRNVSNMIKKPQLHVTEDCGIFTIDIEYDEPISTYPDLHVKLKGNDFETVPYASGKYTLTNKAEQEGIYIFEVALSSNGQFFSCSESYVFKREEISFQSPNYHSNSVDLTFFSLKSYISEDFYGDFQDENTYVYTTLPNQLKNIFEIVNGGVKEERISASCLKNVWSFKINGQDYSDFQLQKLVNLKELLILNCNLPGHFSLVCFKEITDVQLYGNKLTSIEIGQLTKLEELSIADNLLEAAEIEEFAEELWKYRQLIDPSTGLTLIFLDGNPGIPLLSQRCIDIINGTGGFSGDGLVQNDIIFIY